MRAALFLASCILVFGLLVAGYVYAVTTVLLVPDDVSKPYRQFLLEAMAEVDGKVVIDSGSNGLHGIDARTIAETLDAPVIIASDNGGYPLRLKYFRLKRTLNAGDVLVMPLEWDYYSRPDLMTENFLSKVSDRDGEVHHYAAKLPLLEKIRFVLFDYPLEHAFEGLFAALVHPAQDLTRARLFKYGNTVSEESNTAFGGKALDGPEPLNAIVAFSGGCDNYFFWRGEEFALEVSDTFRENLQLLANLQERGVRVLLTWPAVVDLEGKPCYSHPEVRSDLAQYADSVTAAVENAGLVMMGDFRGEHYSSECFLNTHYHLRWSCAPQRTERLLGLLKAHGVTEVETDLPVEKVASYVQDRIRKMKTAHRRSARSD